MLFAPLLALGLLASEPAATQPEGLLLGLSTSFAREKVACIVPMSELKDPAERSLELLNCVLLAPTQTPMNTAAPDAGNSLSSWAIREWVPKMSPELAPFYDRADSIRADLENEVQSTAHFFDHTADRKKVRILANQCARGFNHVYFHEYVRMGRFIYYAAVNTDAYDSTRLFPRSHEIVRGYASRLCALDPETGRVTSLYSMKDFISVYGARQGDFLLFSTEVAQDGSALFLFDAKRKRLVQGLPGYHVAGRLNDSQSLLAHKKGEVAVLDHSTGRMTTLFSLPKGVVLLSPSSLLHGPAPFGQEGGPAVLGGVSERPRVGAPPPLRRGRPLRRCQSQGLQRLHQGPRQPHASLHRLSR
jgi:hypothetical protein